jgi:hypothetical protein
MTKTERTQRDIYGDNDIDDGQDLITQHNQRVAHHRAQHEDDEEEEAMPWNEEEMLAAADAVLGQLDAVQEVPHLRKSLETLTRTVQDQQGRTWQVRSDIDLLQKSLRQAYHSERSNRHAIGQLARAVDRLCKGLIRLGDRPPSPLTKAVASFVQPGDSLAKAKRLTAWVVKSFGARGGQVVPFSREGCARLKLCKAISDTEAENWQRYGRLPDHVNIQHPQPQAHVIAEQDRQLQIGHILASMNISPLALQTLALRRS